MGIPEGTIKWHLNKARNELKEGFFMERKIGKLGLSPITSTGFTHSGNPGSNSGPEFYLGDKLNLNIVYSVYFEPKTKEQIAEVTKKYPFTAAYYVVIREDEPQDSVYRKLRDYMLTEEGQEIVKLAGYCPIGERHE